METLQAQVIDLILQIQQQEYNISITKDDQPDLFTIEEYYQTANGNFWVALYDKKSSWYNQSLRHRE